MFYVYKSLVPVVFGVRFLPLIVHLVILILLVLDPVFTIKIIHIFFNLFSLKFQVFFQIPPNKAPNVKTNLEISGDLTRKSSVENSNFVWLYLSIGFLSLEMISYLAGYTSIYAFQSFICKYFFFDLRKALTIENNFNIYFN